MKSVITSKADLPRSSVSSNACSSTAFLLVRLFSSPAARFDFREEDFLGDCPFAALEECLALLLVLVVSDCSQALKLFHSSVRCLKAAESARFSKASRSYLTWRAECCVLTTVSSAAGGVGARDVGSGEGLLDGGYVSRVETHVLRIETEKNLRFLAWASVFF